MGMIAGVDEVLDSIALGVGALELKGAIVALDSAGAWATWPGAAQADNMVATSAVPIATPNRDPRRTSCGRQSTLSVGMRPQATQGMQRRTRASRYWLQGSSPREG